VGAALPLDSNQPNPIEAYQRNKEWPARLGRAAAGALRNAAGVLMHVGATLTWPGGRRASFECSFDRAPVQHLEVGSR
jgi:hypothetical protein